MLINILKCPILQCWRKCKSDPESRPGPDYRQKLIDSSDWYQVSTKSADYFCSNLAQTGLKTLTKSAKTSLAEIIIMCYCCQLHCHRRGSMRVFEATFKSTHVWLRLSAEWLFVGAVYKIPLSLTHSQRESVCPEEMLMNRRGTFNVCYHNAIKITVINVCA